MSTGYTEHKLTDSTNNWQGQHHVSCCSLRNSICYMDCKRSWLEPAVHLAPACWLYRKPKSCKLCKSRAGLLCSRCSHTNVLWRLHPTPAAADIYVPAHYRANAHWQNSMATKAAAFHAPGPCLRQKLTSELHLLTSSWIQ
jgi:hypothetical protein